MAPYQSIRAVATRITSYNVCYTKLLRIQRALSALEHISELYEQDVEEPHLEQDITKPQPIALLDIEFSHVYFSYSTNGPDVLKDVSFTLKKGDRLALVGTTGSGRNNFV